MAPRYLSSRTMPRGRRVIVRVDFNVPIARGRVGDDFDLVRALPTIRALVRRRNVCVLLSHHSDERQSLAPLAPRLARLLGRPVRFMADPLAGGAAIAVRRARTGAVFLAENLRFWQGEKTASQTFARGLARLGEVFVNDAFGEVHRPYASMVRLPRLLPSFAGQLVASELAMLDRFRLHPRRPLVGIFGGAKLETKLPILKRFSRIADRMLVGGDVANVLLRARGFSTRSRRAPPGVALERLARSPKLLLPVDVVVAGGRHRGRSVPVARMGARNTAYDIGPKTRDLFGRIIRSGRTIVWNGPLGLTEERRFAAGTLAVARALSRHRGTVLVGGGDTVAFLERVGLLKRFRHVSTGGGAMLAYLAGEKLPGLEALEWRRQRKQRGQKEQRR